MVQAKPNQRKPIEPSTLPYSLRIRDLLHGFVYLTELEVQVINHSLSQRLRHIRQNDVASYVYPSLNTSRFEHSLGTAFVAGKMAASIVNHSPRWKEYQKSLNLSKNDFQQVCRLYALLHDVGHLPMSHLFEMAFDDYVRTLADPLPITKVVNEWFGGKGFAKLHEACGSAVATRILSDVRVPDQVRDSVLRLMGTKHLFESDPLRPIKLLVDSEIDADRIDATARDGLLAGGEYGAYDIERLCSAVFVQDYDTTLGQRAWRLTYSHKALGSIEALLLDRCRTHTWIHFHHRVVAMKVAAMELIAALLRCGTISKSDFPIDRPDTMALRDDVWLWWLFRNDKQLEGESGTSKAARNALLYRNKDAITLLWKNRTVYHDLHKKLRGRGGWRGNVHPNDLGRKYEEWLTDQLGLKAIVFWPGFKPVEERSVHLAGDNGEPLQNPVELLEASPLTNSLKTVWDGEPQYYVILLGQPSEPLDMVRNKWVDVTAQWVNAKAG